MTISSANDMGPDLRIPGVALAGDVYIPQLGLGTDRVPPEDTAGAISRALAAGYRHIDTAHVYGNEMEIGRAIRASGLNRSRIFVTTKCSNDHHGYARAMRALKQSLRRLRVDQVDLYLIHWPVPSRDLYVETWQALVEAQRAGLVRAIGVSNFQIEHLRRIADETGVTPAVNQIELHPNFQQPALRREHARRGIVTQAWSPLTLGMILSHPAIVSIANEHRRTPAQVVLRWHIALGNVVFPKSVTTQHMRENIRVFDFDLSNEDMERIAALDQGKRIGPDPDQLVPNPPLPRWRRARVSIGAVRRRAAARFRSRVRG